MNCLTSIHFSIFGELKHLKSSNKTENSYLDKLEWNISEKEKGVIGIK